MKVALEREMESSPEFEPLPGDDWPRVQEDPFNKLGLTERLNAYADLCFRYCETVGMLRATNLTFDSMEKLKKQANLQLRARRISDRLNEILEILRVTERRRGGTEARK